MTLFWARTRSCAGTYDGEVSVIDGVLAESLAESNHRCVGCSESEIDIAVHEIGDPVQVVAGELFDRDGPVVRQSNEAQAR